VCVVTPIEEITSEKTIEENVKELSQDAERDARECKGRLRDDFLYLLKSFQVLKL